MSNLWWLLIWAFVAVPAPSSITAHKLFKKARKDYAYYLEWKAFPFLKILVSKFAAYSSMGFVLLLFSVPSNAMSIALVALGAGGFVAESIILIGRPHPTRSYRSLGSACESCKMNKCDNCTNLRMLDSFETAFKSREGLYRPFCCCGFRIKTWREVVT